MYRISKEFHFCAAHQLHGLSANHPCSRLHGHNYVVTFTFEAAELNKHGFVVDYRDLEYIKLFIDDTFDHKNLNDFHAFSIEKNSEAKNPTAENLAEVLFRLFDYSQPDAMLVSVEVKETPKTSAIFWGNV